MFITRGGKEHEVLVRGKYYRGSEEPGDESELYDIEAVYHSDGMKVTDFSEPETETARAHLLDAC